jgi:hypothetical protein
LVIKNKNKNKNKNENKNIKLYFLLLNDEDGGKLWGVTT